MGEYYDPVRRPYEFANLIKNQDMSRGIETDPRFHEHPTDHDQIFRISRRKRHTGSSKLTVREQLEDLARSTASRTTGDASDRVIPWETVACSTNSPTTSRRKNSEKPS